MFLVPVNRVHGIMGKCTVLSQVTRNGKVQRCGLWTGHHTGNSERIWLQGDFSRHSEAVMPEGVPASLFYQVNLGGFLMMMVRNEIKAQIVRAGYTMQEVVDRLHA